MIQEKPLLFSGFDLFCRLFWIFLNLFCPSVVGVSFIGTKKSNYAFKLFFFPQSHFLFFHYPLPLCWVFAVLWSLTLFFFFSPFSFFNFYFFKPIIFFSTSIPSSAFPIILFLLQLIFNIYKSLPLFNVAYVFFSFSPFLSTYLLVLFSLLYSPIDTLL